MECHVAGCRKRVVARLREDAFCCSRHGGECAKVFSTHDRLEPAPTKKAKASGGPAATTPPRRLKGCLVATTTRAGAVTSKVIERGTGPAAQMWRTRFEDGTSKLLSDFSVRRGAALYAMLLGGSDFCGHVADPEDPENVEEYYSMYGSEFPNMAELGVATVTHLSEKLFVDKFIYKESLPGSRFFFSLNNCVAAARANRRHNTEKVPAPGRSGGGAVLAPLFGPLAP